MNLDTDSSRLKLARELCRVQQNNRFERVMRENTSHDTSKKTAYRFRFRNATNCDLDNAPTLVAATAPSLNSIRVGIPRMP